METKATLVQPAEAKAAVATGFLKNNLREYGMLISLIAIMCFFQYCSTSWMPTPYAFLKASSWKL